MSPDSVVSGFPGSLCRGDDAIVLNPVEVNHTAATTRFFLENALTSGDSSTGQSTPERFANAIGESHTLHRSATV